MAYKRIFTACRHAAAATLLAAAGAVSGADIYVSGTGLDSYAVNSIGTPWRTLTKAVSRVRPGDTVWIMNGTYPRFSASVHGTAAAPITWKAYPGHAPEITASDIDFSVVGITGAYQVFDGLIVTGNNDKQTLAQAEADYNKSVQTFFLRNPVTGLPDINPATGLPVTADTPNPTYLAGYGGDPKFQTSGFSIDNRARRLRAHHVTIRNSTMRKLGCAGFVGLETDYITLENNRIHANAWYSRFGCSGGSLFTHSMERGDATPGYRNLIRNNVFWDNKGLVKWLAAGKYSDGNGFILDVGDTDYLGRTLIANNLSVFNGGSGIHAFKGLGVDILNNTAVMNGQKVGSPDLYVHTTTDARLLNNVIYSRPGAYSNSNTANFNVLYDFNIWFNGSVAGTLTRVMGANDIKADPLFASTQYDAANGPAPGAFRLAAGSPGIDSGVNLQTAPTFVPDKDIEGTARPQGAGVDRGAYEAAAS